MNRRKGCSPPGTGGVAAPVIKRREASEAAQPPLLSEEGNTLSWQFVHTFYDRRYSSLVYVFDADQIGEEPVGALYPSG